MSIIFIFVLTGFDSPLRHFTCQARELFCFPLLVFGEPSRPPKLDTSDWFYCGLSSPLGFLTNIRSAPLGWDDASAWFSLFLKCKLYRSFASEATKAVLQGPVSCAWNELPGYGPFYAWHICLIYCFGVGSTYIWWFLMPEAWRQQWISNCKREKKGRTLNETSSVVGLKLIILQNK